MALFKKDVLQSAEKLVQKGKIEAAIKEYKKVVAKNPSDTNTLNRVGDLYVRLRKHADAVEYYMKTAERYALDGFYVKAIAVYKKVQRIDSGAVAVHGRLADLYAKQGLINEARSHLNQLADHHLRNNDTPSAITVYEKVVDLDRDSPTPLLRLADLYRENNQPGKATDAYQKIANLMLQRGQVDHAVQVYDRALAIEAGNLEFVSQAVLKIRDAGGVERALDLVARAERHNPAASELRSLITRPQQTPGSVVAADLLAPLEEVEAQPAEHFAPPPPVLPVEIPAMVSDDTDFDISLDLGAIDDNREESRQSLVDPASFVGFEESSKPEIPAAEVSVAAAETRDAPAPQEPFSLHQRGGVAAMFNDPGPDAPDAEQSIPAPSQPPTSAAEDDLGSGPLGSGEIDLGEIGDITVSAADLGAVGADQDAWDAGAVEGPPAAGVDLDAAFDRQVDPGPVDLPALPDLGGGAVMNIGSGQLAGPVAGEMPPADPIAPPMEEAPAAEEEPEGLAEKLSEAGVFRKYGLLDKALDRLNEVLALVPDHLDALSQAIQVLVERGDEARASTKAETLHLLCAQRNERDRWVGIQELLESEGYEIDGDRVRTPGELAMAQGAIEDMPVADDPYDQVPKDADAEDDALDRVADAADRADFSALASESLDIQIGEGHDMLDSKEFPVQERPLSWGVDSRPGDVGDEADQVASADQSTPSWLDGADSTESADAEDIFDEEEEFFDLATELQDELGTDLNSLDESLPDNAAEQSLEEIVEGFKRGVADNISDEESDTHYNLGIAYREMMLLDEAINEFQISAKSSDFLIESCAMLGLCFREKGLADLAAKWYQRALDAPELLEEQRVGMLYELADSTQAAGDSAAARDLFTQVAAASDNYRDVVAKLAALGGAADA